MMSARKVDTMMSENMLLSEGKLLIWKNCIPKSIFVWWIKKKKGNFFSLSTHNAMNYQFDKKKR